MYTVPDLLTTQTHQRGSHPALIDGGLRISYTELEDLARRCATRIRRRVEPGQRVAVLLPRSVDALAAYFGAHFAATVPVIISERLRARQVAHIIRNSGARLVFTDNHHQELLRDSALPAD